MNDPAHEHDQHADQRLDQDHHEAEHRRSAHGVSTRVEPERADQQAEDGEQAEARGQPMRELDQSVK